MRCSNETFKPTIESSNMTTEKPGLFNKARVSNIMAAFTIGAVVYGFVTGLPETVIEGSGMGILLGFAAKHLWDSSQS